MPPDTVVERPTRESAFCKSNNIVTFAGAACRAGRYDSYGMKKLITTLAVVLCCTLGTVALAADPHTSSTKGQPSQSCETSMVTPGKTANLPAHSVFNEDSKASAHYANPTTQGGISSGNMHVVANTTLRASSKPTGCCNSPRECPSGMGADAGAKLH